MGTLLVSLPIPTGQQIILVNPLGQVISAQVQPNYLSSSADVATLLSQMNAAVPLGTEFAFLNSFYTFTGFTSMDELGAISATSGFKWILPTQAPPPAPQIGGFVIMMNFKQKGFSGGPSFNVGVAGMLIAGMGGLTAKGAYSLVPGTGEFAPPPKLQWNPASA